MLSAWIDRWLEAGYESANQGERPVLRSNIAWFLAYRLGL